MNKRALYENIMSKVSREVKRAIYEDSVGFKPTVRDWEDFIQGKYAIFDELEGEPIYIYYDYENGKLVTGDLDRNGRLVPNFIAEVPVENNEFYWPLETMFDELYNLYNV